MGSGEEERNGSPQGKRERGKEPEQQGKGKEPEQQAHKPTKKGTPPPSCKGAGSPSPHHKFAPKNQQKVAWGDLKKFSEKFFVGMFRGQEKPLAFLNGRGRQQMKNCNVSNLGNASNQKRTKALLNQGQR